MGAASVDLKKIAHPLLAGQRARARNAIERAMILEETGYIQPQSLPIAVRGEPFHRSWDWRTA
jgi:hypothetical protein